MASRPIFLPASQGDHLVEEVYVDFPWHPGMAPSQKVKNVQELHLAGEVAGLFPLLEISSKSREKVGQRLSAFSLEIQTEWGESIPLESAFQGSKVFANGGPFQELYRVDARTARSDPRLRDSGEIIAFRLGDMTFPASPRTGFYDWLYISALSPHIDWIRNRVGSYQGYTDIEFNPSRSINCQARSFALLLSLDSRDLLQGTARDYWKLTALFQKSRYWVRMDAERRPMLDT